MKSNQQLYDLYMKNFKNNFINHKKLIIFLKIKGKIVKKEGLK